MFLPSTRIVTLSSFFVLWPWYFLFSRIDKRFETWKRLVAGLDDDNYLHGLAVDSRDPKTVVVSASKGAYQAHSREIPDHLVCVRIHPDNPSDIQLYMVLTTTALTAGQTFTSDTGIT